MSDNRPLLTHLGLMALCSLALLSAGCYITSIHPVATLDQRLFDKELIGAWTSGHDTVRISGETTENLTFDVTEGPGVLSDSVRTGTLGLMLTNIEDQTFMDVRPLEVQESKTPILEQMLFVPAHGIIRYAVNKDTLSIEYLNYAEFHRMKADGKLRGLEVEAVEDDGPLLITSSTARIRDFLADHKGDKQLYGDPINYVRLK